MAKGFFFNFYSPGGQLASIKKRTVEQPYIKTYDPLPATMVLIAEPNNGTANDSLKSFILNYIETWLENVQSSKEDKKRNIIVSFDDYQKNDIVDDVTEIAKLWGRFFIATSGNDSTSETDSLRREFEQNLIAFTAKVCKRENCFSKWMNTFFCIWRKSIYHDAAKEKKIRVKDYVFNKILTPFWRSKFDYDTNKPIGEYINHDCFKTLYSINPKYRDVIKSKYIDIPPLKYDQEKILRDAQVEYFKQLLRRLWKPLTLEIEKDKICWALNQLPPSEARIAEKISLRDLGSVDRELNLRGRFSFSEISKKVRENIMAAWAYDLHVHTRKSDGAEFPANLTAHRCIKNLDGVAIMDHEGVGIKALKEYIRIYSEGDAGRLIIGQEIEVAGGFKSGVELSVFFLNLEATTLMKHSEKDISDLARKLSCGSSPHPDLEILIDKLIELDATFVITHPYGREYSFLHDTDERLDRLINYLIKKGKDGEQLVIEVYNAKSGINDDVNSPNGKSRKIANHYPLNNKGIKPYHFPICAGSDSHSGFFDIGTGYCILKRPTKHTSDEFLENLQNALICKPKEYWFNSAEFKKGFAFIFKNIK